MLNRRQIGIFGGTFNPPHNGHVQLARAFLAQAALDEVWLMVSPQNPFKASADLPADEYRLRLVQAAVEGERGLRASDFEFRLPRPSYTWNTLQALTRAWPDCDFSLLVGGDNWAAFDRWAHPHDILRHHRLFVYPRPGSPINEASLPPSVHLLRGKMLDISSTEIRRRRATGQDISGLVPPAVAALMC